MSNQYPPIRRSRMEQHAKKRRKKDFILNILIGIVFLAILVVGYSILFGDDSKDEMAMDTQGEETENNNGSLIGEEREEDEEIEESEGDGNDSFDEEETETNEPVTSDNEQTNTDEEMTNEETGEQIVEQSSDDPNVIKAVIDPSWEPIGTSQTGEHITVYDKGSTDRIEMEQALAYATNTTVDNLTIWWLQRGEIVNKHVIGTVETKNDGQVYRVYLEWIDGQGWKPTKMEYLKENDKES
ncbi:YrrS family protein [Fervidibacillus albus]|uniref:YrrS family protein n=1 Tax=Fervidibacillus albus TaxID=2980026 RepID=A0A9E8LVJ6_9BACI|nr:YrrS family protein [Fervidibacillus albus]WAA10296.1 YrrS family protein [Fervidibacillus albus]